MAAGWFSGNAGKNAGDPLEVLALLANKRTPVRIEVEKSLLRFNSLLTLRENAVVIGKPLGVQDNLVKGDYVRITWTDAKGKHGFRVEVSVPHFNLSNGLASFICKPPEKAETLKRSHERHDISHFNNVTLRIDGKAYRVVDLSVKGCRVVGGGEFLRACPIGKSARTAVLKIGDHEPIHFENLIARSQQREFVGCEFKVEQDGKSPRRFLEVLKSVEGHESSHLHRG